MKKLVIALMLCLPMMALAQTVLTPEEQLEQAQKQLKEAQKAVEQAKAKAAEAAQAKAKADAAAKQKAEAQAKAKAEEIQKKSWAVRSRFKCSGDTEKDCCDQGEGCPAQCRGRKTATRNGPHAIVGRMEHTGIGFQDDFLPGSQP